MLNICPGFLNTYLNDKFLFDICVFVDGNVNIGHRDGKSQDVKHWSTSRGLPSFRYLQQFRGEGQHETEKRTALASFPSAISPPRLQQNSGSVDGSECNIKPRRNT